MVALGAVDIGTNSVLLAIANLDTSGSRALTPLLERATITRLGQGVDRTRRLHSSAAQRTLECLRDYAAELTLLEVRSVAAVGTSALRDAAESGEFLARAREILGVAPRVISGDEEAELTFRGALSGLVLEGPVLVVDIGGGSTELILGAASPPRIDSTRSLDLGSVRLTERHLEADPPSPAELRALREDVRSWLVAAPPPGAGATLVGVAGTVTSVAAVRSGIAPYDAARIHGATLDARSISSVAERLARLTLGARRRVRGLDPARADVIVAGAILLDEVVAWAGARGVVVSDRGVRWGLLERLATDISPGA